MFELNIDEGYSIAERISFNGKYYVTEYFRRRSDLTVLAYSPDFSSIYSYTSYVDLDYLLNCIPFIVNSVVSFEDGYKYFVQDTYNLLETFRDFKEVFVFNTGMNAILVDVNIYESFIVLDQEIQVNTFLYILPWEIERIFNLTSENCHIERKLGIGTQFPDQKLTVEGNAAVKNSIIYRTFTDSNQFVTKFDGSKFYMGDSITITSNNDVNINGNIAAISYLNYSDSRIKRNIVASSEKGDVERVKKINIYDYQFLKTNSLHKGVIADEIESICPEFVSLKYEYLPIVNKMCAIDKISSSIIIENIDERYKKEFKKGIQLRIDTGYDINICDVQFIENKILLKSPQISTLLMCNSVYVFGPYVNIKVIDKDSIMWTLFNCVKSALKEIEQLKSSKI
jgi:hypothetical protein